MPHRCVAGGCSNTAKDGVSLHGWPKIAQLARQRTNAVRNMPANFQGFIWNTVSDFPFVRVKQKFHLRYTVSQVPNHEILHESLSMELLGRVVQSPITLTQDKKQFCFVLCNFAVSFSVYIVWPYVLILNNLKLRQEPMTQKQWKTFV